MTWQPSDHSIPSDILDSAADDTRHGRYADALAKFVWFHDASRNELGMGGVRLSFALGYWLDLASHYPPALEAFVKVRDTTEERCRSQRDFKSFHEVAALNDRLHENRRTIELFQQVAQADPAKGHELYHVVERFLVAAGQYADCAPYLEWQERFEIALSGYQLLVEQEASYSDDELHPPLIARRLFEEEMATLVALLALNDRKPEAEQLCERCLAVLDDEAFRNTLSNTLNKALSGHFPRGHFAAEE
jgi:hypothetical protein